MSDDGAPSQGFGDDSRQDRAGISSFFAKALELIGPPYMKLLVVLVVAALSAPQAVSYSASPRLALVLVVVCILFFAFLALKLEFRDRQYREKELETLKDGFRRKVLEMQLEVDAFKQQLRLEVSQMQSKTPRKKPGKAVGL